MTTESPIPKSLLRQRYLLFGMILLLAILALILIWPFGISILFAIAIVVLMKPVYNWLLEKKWVKGKATRATGGTLLIFILAIGIPIVFIIGGAISQANQAYESLQGADLELTPEGIATWVQDILQDTGQEDVSVDEADIAAMLQEAGAALVGWVGETIVSLAQSIPRFFTNAIVVLVLMFVMLPLYKNPGKDAVAEIVPFPPEITQLFMDKSDMMITAMFKGTFVIAIVSGAAMGIVFWIAGVPYVTLLSIISALVVANIDNILRPMLVPKGAHLNPALVILSVLGGLILMGFIGVIYGPVIMILLVTSIEVYTRYMLRSDLEALQEHGRIDLEALGLTPEEDDEGEKSVGEMVTTALKNLSARTRGDSSKGEDDDQPEVEVAESPE